MLMAAEVRKLMKTTAFAALEIEIEIVRVCVFAAPREAYQASFQVFQIRTVPRSSPDVHLDYMGTGWGKRDVLNFGYLFPKEMIQHVDKRRKT